MSRFIMRNLLLLLSIAGYSASSDILVPHTIAAGTDVRIAINTNLPYSNDSNYDKYGVFLSINTPNTATPSFVACYLYKSLALNLANLLFRIPPSVGPSGTYYSFTAIAYSGDPISYHEECNFPQLRSSTDPVDLIGATGTFTQFETDVLHAPGDFWNIPCDSYDCVRQCNQAGYPNNNKDWPHSYRSTYQCIAACQAVTYRSFDDYFGPCNSTINTASASRAQSGGSSTESRVTTRLHTVIESSVASTTSIAPSTTVAYSSATSQVPKPSETTKTSLSDFRGVNRRLYLAATSILGLLYGRIMV